MGFLVSPAGRPEIGKPINVRLGDRTLSMVDAYAATHKIKRAEALRQLVLTGIAFTPDKNEFGDTFDADY